MEHGYIYVLTNIAMPGVVKVGKTTRHPSDRANQLSSATGVPAKFTLHHAFEVIDCSTAEKTAHRVLEQAFGRPNSSREFFVGEPHDVCALLEDALRELSARSESCSSSDLSAAIKRVLNKEFSFACLELEALFQQGCVTEEKLLHSTSLQQAAGAYLAACIGAGAMPRLSCVIAPRVKALVMECAIRHVSDFDDNPKTRVIDFVRTATDAQRHG